MALRLAVAALLVAPVTVAGQDVTINPYIGYYDFDESSFEDSLEDVRSDADPLWGARLGLGGSSGGIGFDLAYGRASIDNTALLGDIQIIEEATIQLFYGAANWNLPLGPLTLFLSGGAGAITYSSDDRDGQTDVLVNFGAGATIPVGPARLRVDVKDHVDLCRYDEDTFEYPDGPCFDDQTLHNIEISAGLVIGR